MVWRIAIEQAANPTDAKVEVAKQSAPQIAAGQMPSNIPALIGSVIDVVGTGPEGLLINAFANTNTGHIGSITIIIQPTTPPMA
jgi:hypothetical protein